jgi:hypothetical protein
MAKNWANFDEAPPFGNEASGTRRWTRPRGGGRMGLGVTDRDGKVPDEKGAKRDRP